MLVRRVYVWASAVLSPCDTNRPLYLTFMEYGVCHQPSCKIRKVRWSSSKAYLTHQTDSSFGSGSGSMPHYTLPSTIHRANWSKKVPVHKVKDQVNWADGVEFFSLALLLLMLLLARTGRSRISLIGSCFHLLLFDRGRCRLEVHLHLVRHTREQVEFLLLAGIMPKEPPLFSAHVRHKSNSLDWLEPCSEEGR